jgi:hypothetical protein
MVNLIGGRAGSIAFVLLQVRPTPVFLFLIALLAGWCLAGAPQCRTPPPNFTLAL